MPVCQSGLLLVILLFYFPSSFFLSKSIPTSLGLGLVTDVGILVAHADHDADVTGAANDGGEDGAGSVITGEAGLKGKCQYT